MENRKCKHDKKAGTLTKLIFKTTSLCDQAQSHSSLGGFNVTFSRSLADRLVTSKPDPQALTGTPKTIDDHTSVSCMALDGALDRRKSRTVEQATKTASSWQLVPRPFLCHCRINPSQQKANCSPEPPKSPRLGELTSL